MNNIVIIPKGKGVYSSNLKAIELKSDNKNMTSKEFFDSFISQNKEKIYQDARNNTKYNANGQAVISKNNPSFYEDEWDEHFKDIKEN